MNIRDLWERLRTGVVLEVTWDFTPHGTSVGAQWRITRKTASAVAGTIFPAKTPFRFNRYKATDVKIDGPDAYTVLENGVPVWSFRINEASVRPRLLTATDLLRYVLTEVDGNVDQARALLARTDHPERRSASRILERDANNKKGATHVRYVGHGCFEAEEPDLFIEAVDYDRTTTRRIGPWDSEAYGPFRTIGRGYGCRELDEARRFIAPDAYMLRVVNHVGRVVATSPSIYCNDGTPAREDWERRSA